MTQTKKVAIFGGGLGGLAVANALTTFGMKADIYEASPSLGEVGAGVTTSPQANKVLMAIGLDEKLAAVAVSFDRHANLQHADWRTDRVLRSDQGGSAV